MHYFEVAFQKIIRSDQETFTYHSPTTLSVGTFVKATIGKKELVGVVIRSTQKPSYETKALSTLNIPPITPQLLELALWMGKYYNTHLALVLGTILPTGIAKKRRERINPNLPKSKRKKITILTKEQKDAVACINKSKKNSCVLHGITGSGKTRVYVELIQQAIQRQKSALILVPEIGLTSQLISELSIYFPKIIVTHSQQTEAERHLTWLQIANNNQPAVVIGPRSSLFMPFKDLGLIVIDESHEPSYKQEKSPRYSALRVGAKLSQLFDAKIIYGSATPPVSEYYLAKHTKTPIVKISTKARSQTTKPSIKVMDLTDKSTRKRSLLFSEQLLCSIEKALSLKKQVLLFHNRRGSAATTLCEQCGWSAICPRCTIPYTLHSDIHSLVCHICDNKGRIPTSCPDCSSIDIIHKGIGTKRIEQEINKLFPNASAIRFDSDTVKDNSLEKRYTDLYDGSIDIIIGTQVIAKGLDLPKLHTAGVVQADAGLALPDHTSNERVFQLLTQVIGRVGRYKHKTELIIQSYQPNHPSIQAGINQDYAEFYNYHLAALKKGNFPPFCHLLKLTCTYKTERSAINNSKKLRKILSNKHKGILFSPATPAFYERKNNSYRWQIIAKAKERHNIINVIDDIPSANWQYELDPITLL